LQTVTLNPETAAAELSAACSRQYGPCSYFARMFLTEVECQADSYTCDSMQISVKMEVRGSRQRSPFESACTDFQAVGTGEYILVVTSPASDKTMRVPNMAPCKRTGPHVPLPGVCINSKCSETFDAYVVHNMKNNTVRRDGYWKPVPATNSCIHGYDLIERDCETRISRFPAFPNDR